MYQKSSLSFQVCGRRVASPPVQCLKTGLKIRRKKCETSYASLQWHPILLSCSTLKSSANECTKRLESTSHDFLAAVRNFSASHEISNQNNGRTTFRMLNARGESWVGFLGKNRKGFIPLKWNAAVMGSVICASTANLFHSK